MVAAADNEAKPLMEKGRENQEKKEKEREEESHQSSIAKALTSTASPVEWLRSLRTKMKTEREADLRVMINKVKHLGSEMWQKVRSAAESTEFTDLSEILHRLGSRSEGGEAEDGGGGERTEEVREGGGEGAGIISTSEPQVDSTGQGGALSSSDGGRESQEGGSGSISTGGKEEESRRGASPHLPQVETETETEMTAAASEVRAPPPVSASTPAREEEQAVNTTEGMGVDPAAVTPGVVRPAPDDAEGEWQMC